MSQECNLAMLHNYKYKYLGARYMTLSHMCNTPWVDVSDVELGDGSVYPGVYGLSDFGEHVVIEMNR